MVPTSNIFKEYKNQDNYWRVGGIKMFHVYIFRYDRWQHDMTPMIIPFKYEPLYRTIMGINLHYLHPDIRIMTLETIDKLKLINPETKEIVINYRLLQELFKDVSICIRRYKDDGISFLRYIPLSDFLDRHWQSPGAIEESWRRRIHERSLKALKISLHDLNKGVV